MHLERGLYGRPNKDDDATTQIYTKPCAGRATMRNGGVSRSPWSQARCGKPLRLLLLLLFRRPLRRFAAVEIIRTEVGKVYIYRGHLRHSRTRPSRAEAVARAGGGASRR